VHWPWLRGAPVSLRTTEQDIQARGIKDAWVEWNPMGLAVANSAKRDLIGGEGGHKVVADYGAGQIRKFSLHPRLLTGCDRGGTNSP